MLLADILRLEINAVMKFYSSGTSEENKKNLNKRWLSIFELFIILSCIIFWETMPSIGGYLLPVAFLPIIFRIILGSVPVSASRFVLFPLLFLITAWISITPSYSSQNAWQKWWLLVGGIFLFYSLCLQKKQNHWLIAYLVSAFGGLMACLFLFANDWQANPAKIGVINQIGLWWMNIRPNFLITRIYQNAAAEVIAFTLPYTMAIGLMAWRKKSIARGLWFLVISGIALIGLLLTTSRGAVIALFFGFLVWAFLYVSEKRVWIFRHFSNAWMRTGSLFVILLAGGLLLIYFAGPVTLVSNISALSNSGSRLSLFTDSLRLVQDYPIIGAGLASFPGNYSNYILSTPVYFFQNSHNLYINVAIEQGILGSVILISFFLYCIVSLSRNSDSRSSWLVGATLASLVIIALHSLVDNIIDESFLTPIIFLIPGFSRALVRADERVYSPSLSFNKIISWIKSIRMTRKLAAGIAGIALVIIVALVNRFELLSTWYSNQGSIAMAKAELAGFPTNQWETKSILPALAPAEIDFLQSLKYNPNNRTANHRLGLIAMLREDLPSAIAYLEAAYRADPGHRGVMKSLGYAYTWSGQYDKALALLQQIPEARQELETYTWWWTTQNRADFSMKSGLMAKQLSP
jgi:O-antigen ligase